MNETMYLLNDRFSIKESLYKASLRVPFNAVTVYKLDGSLFYFTCISRYYNTIVGAPKIKVDNHSQLDCLVSISHDQDYLMSSVIICEK